MNANLLIDERVFRFGQFELMPRSRLLTWADHSVKVGSRALDILIALVESAGRVVVKEDLMSRVWRNILVDDTNLRVHISTLRRVLGEDGLESRYIVHVARRGYIFVTPLRLDDRVSLREALLFTMGMLRASVFSFDSV